MMTQAFSFAAPHPSEASAEASLLDLVRLAPLMEQTEGIADVVVGLVDGPAALDHSGLKGAHVREIADTGSGACKQGDSEACAHGTFMAGILAARRDSVAPAICPACTLLVRPVFTEKGLGESGLLVATPDELAAAIADTVEAGAHVLNLSLALTRSSTGEERKIGEALDYAMSRGVIVSVAAGNEGAIAGSVMTRHPWVIPVAACDRHGRPISQSNFSPSVGRRGLLAPGEAVISLGPGGSPTLSGGTSVATAFVTGATALLLSAVPAANPSEVKYAIMQAASPRRSGIVPPLLDAWAAYQHLEGNAVARG
jgi:subtilisin family serine protease